MIIWKHLLSSYSVAGTILHPLNVSTHDILTKAIEADIITISILQREEKWDKRKVK